MSQECGGTWRTPISTPSLWSLVNREVELPGALVAGGSGNLDTVSVSFGVLEIEIWRSPALISRIRPKLSTLGTPACGVTNS